MFFELRKTRCSGPEQKTGRRRIRPVCEAMEPRRLMAGDLNAFASIPIPAPPMSGGASAVTFRIQRGDFTMTRAGSDWLRIADTDPSVASPTLGTVTGTFMSPSGLVTRNAQTRALPGGQELVKVRFGTYTLSVGPISPTAPLGSVSFALAGAVVGSSVDARSLAAIRARLGQKAGSPGYLAAADVNDDGVINRADLRLARQNLGARTSVRPLAVDVTTNLTPIDDLISKRTISIRSNRPASASVATSDPVTGALGPPRYFTTDAGAPGHVVAGELTDSYDAFQITVQASDSFGQYRLITTQVPSAIGEGYGAEYQDDPPYNPSLAPPASESQNIPQASEVNKKLAQHVYNQGDTNSCIANALGWDYAYVEKKEGLTGTRFNDPSRLFLYYNSRAYEGLRPMVDKGTYDAAMIRTMTTQGVAPESSWRWSFKTEVVNATPTASAYAAASSHHVLQYYQLNPLDPTQIEGSIAAGFPVVLCIEVFPSFNTAATRSTGVVSMPAPNERVAYGHCVAIVGYDTATDRFTFVNSWGYNWGNAGYGTLPFAYVQKYGSGLYSIRQDN